jgi:cytochrome c biogenesis factor
MAVAWNAPAAQAALLLQDRPITRLLLGHLGVTESVLMTFSIMAASFSAFTLTFSSPFSANASAPTTFLHLPPQASVSADDHPFMRD